ncbi:hypothetical protein P389DRAFT_3529 [Cystobasidium minutum MCA 4210]|uniref:uncharacterized protein n=1 Tax=Cystobasidium minutum MCA 4210 TaxID=1397322 RepID=UPI0034CF0C94|eukprot:jgi/Rhomi1/3529/CE3528_2850
MPSSRAVWLISSPLSPSADAAEMNQDLAARLDPSLQPDFSSLNTGDAASTSKAALRKVTGRTLACVGRVEWGDFKTGTLSSLLTLADTIAKHDAVFNAVTDKIVDTIRNLTTQQDGNAATYTRHLLTEDGHPYLSPLSNATLLDLSSSNNDAAAAMSEGPTGWTWNRAKYRVEGRALSDVVDALAKDMQSLDTIHKQKLSSYNIAKGQLATIQRKRQGNLATRDLSTVVRKDQLPDLADSEFLETVFVAVPKNNVKDFENKYERLTSMVVPRSATKVAQDNDFALYTVTIFRRVRDEFAQKCRDEKFVVREFVYDEAAVEKQNQELVELEASEKELWTDLLRVSRINFSEAYSLIIHLKVVASYVECVLRYGLPAEYFICAVTPNIAASSSNAKKTLNELTNYFKPFTPNLDKATMARLVGGANKKKSKKFSGGDIDENALVGEFQNMMDQEVFEFVLQEVPVYEAASS